MTNRVFFNVADLVFGIAERCQSNRNGAVDDFEVAATGEFFKLHQCEVRLDPGGVAIHDQTDGAGRGNNGGLCVAIAMLFAKLKRLVPCSTGGNRKIGIGAVSSNQRNRIDGEAFVSVLFAISGTAMVAHDAQHFVGVVAISREGTLFTGHFGGGGIGNTTHDRGQGRANRTAFVAVI